jgi:hypothetical protein
MLAATSALVSFLIVGCEHEVSRTKSTRVNRDGTVDSKEKTVTQSPDGTIRTEETRKTGRP